MIETERESVRGRDREINIDKDQARRREKNTARLARREKKRGDDVIFSTLTPLVREVENSGGG